MLERLEAMENELSALIESLRTGGTRLNADLQLLENNLDEVRDAVAPRPRFEPEASAARTVESPRRAEVAEPEGLPPAKVHGDSLVEAREPVAAAASPEHSNGFDDPEGARLIALNMALSGASREEVERHLAENFRLQDRRGLLDEVYASLEG
jgi:hypothetical protein